MSIVTVAEGRRIGRVNGVELDTGEHRVRFLCYDGEHLVDGVVPWERVRSIRGDAVTVDSISAIAEHVPAELGDRLTLRVGDRPVVTEDGNHLGTITGYDIDDISGRVLCYRIGARGLIARLTHRELSFPPESVRAFGRDAIIVVNTVQMPKAA